MYPLLASIPEEAIALVAIGGGLVIALVAIVGGLIKSTVETKEREKTRREIAAYIAEGTMTAEDAEKVLAAKSGGKSACG